jgi:hypothetical protein
MFAYTIRPFWGLIILSMFGLSAGCSDHVNETDEPLDQTEFVPVAGKADTAYYSNLATELEGEFTAIMRLDVSELEPAARQVERDRLDTNRYALRQLAGLQLKLAKAQLNDEKLHLNLAADSVDIDSIELQDTVIEVAYRITVETLVTKKELRAEGIKPEDLIDTTFQVKVASDPRDLFERAGANCAVGFDPGSLGDENYFYYFDPTQENCALEMAPRAEFRVRSLLPEKDTFPEYDKLVADGRIDAAVVFGAAENGVVHGGDWGVMMWRTFEVNLRIAGFKAMDGVTIGSRFERIKAGLLEAITVISPYDLEALGSGGTDLFADLLKTNEMLFYNGHSFYGSLDVLGKKENYPPDTYQILFMNSCWSYEYYTRQVAQARTDDNDPTGWGLVDVVNNTTYAYFSQMERSSRTLLFNILAGAESLGIGEGGRRFSWQNIIATLNRNAKGECPREDPTMDFDCRHYRPRAAHEMYGVSGVTNNEFQPN